MYSKQKTNIFIISFILFQLGPRQWEAYICMEEPFDRTNAGRAIIRREKFDLILNAFKSAAKKIRKGGGLAKLLNNKTDWIEIVDEIIGFIINICYKG